MNLNLQPPMSVAPIARFEHSHRPNVVARAVASLRKQRRKARKWQPPASFNLIATLIVFAASLFLAYQAWDYYEYTPWTRDGRVRVYTVQIAPEVSGVVVALNVRDNQFVHKGDLLFKMDPRTYENIITEAEGELEQAKAKATYLDADARRKEQLDNLAISDQAKENARGYARTADASITQLTGALRQAKLQLERTEIRSPTDGWITNLLLQEGGFATSGQAAMTLVDAHSFWVEGYFEETQLGHIAIGNPATAVLLGYPGRTVTGHVSGIGRGITVSDAAVGVQGLPAVNPVFTWVRLAQRVPVRMEIDDLPPDVLLSAGMTASVSVLGPEAAHRVSDTGRHDPEEGAKS
jgi:multidrug resistance efflux pump